MKKTVVVVGGSRGIGAAVAKHLDESGYQVFSVARTQVAAGEWIQADLSSAEGASTVARALGDEVIDALLYMGGTWEQGAFTSDYSFLRSSDAETRNVVAVNLIAPIELTRSLADNLAQAKNPRALYIGALSGLDQSATQEVANTASKFGLRGAVQSLRLALVNKGIGFTVINPGNVETEEVLDDIREGRFEAQTPIPMSDLLSAIDWLLSLSPNVEVGDINLVQRRPRET